MDNKRRTILFIDDEIDLVEAVSFQLKAKEGYNVVTAHNGVEGLEKLKTTEPHLIILDMNMPKMGGIEFYKLISDEHGRSRYPVLVLTARANLEQLFKELNVDGFMTKPFKLEELFSEIRIILAKRYGATEAVKPVFLTSPEKVLIVEDDEKAFDRIAIAFLNSGYTVSRSRTGLETIDRIIECTPDLILIKLGLSDLPGDIVAAKLKQMPKTMDIPCVLYTPENDKLNHAVTDKICEKAGIGRLVISDDPKVLLEEIGKMVDKK